MFLQVENPDLALRGESAKATSSFLQIQTKKLHNVGLARLLRIRRRLSPVRSYETGTSVPNKSKGVRRMDRECKPTRVNICPLASSLEL
jgi:hypothetical protein